MKELYLRLDDDLHRRLEERAAEQDRSLNDLVTSVLAAAVADDAASIRHRIETSGLRVLPPQPIVPVDRTAIVDQRPGAGRAVIEALSADRDGR